MFSRKLFLSIVFGLISFSVLSQTAMINVDGRDAVSFNG
ncbi:MAG: hypothetical protein JG782_419 [Anaerophaga sp.]|nr:hypothetical protein [Anaerophaga sp.]MDI3521007.1 hypothetical protein [Anaerophaga sp.]MDK2842626.1 hypothetical protein [Anaerophaga sp.]MDN5291647.1 hypothetical protein [Anaerophaga sp.]